MTAGRIISLVLFVILCFITPYALASYGYVVEGTVFSLCVVYWSRNIVDFIIEFPNNNSTRSMYE